MILNTDFDLLVGLFGLHFYSHFCSSEIYHQQKDCKQPTAERMHINKKDGPWETRVSPLIQSTPPKFKLKFNIDPEKWWLEDDPFLGLC